MPVDYLGKNVESGGLRKNAEATKSLQDLDLLSGKELKWSEVYVLAVSGVHYENQKSSLLFSKNDSHSLS